jgi:CHAT domain-containing protein/Tfp pilus assembly protein PilF
MKSLDRYASAICCLGLISIPLFTSIPALSQESVPSTQTSIAALLEVQGTLEPGDGILADGSLYDEYSFAGRAGQSIIIVLESLEFDPYLILIDAQGQTLGENDDFAQDNYNSVVTITLPKNGMYRVLANAYSAEDRGRYTLTIHPALARQSQPQFSDRALQQVAANRLLREGNEQTSSAQLQAALQSFQQALLIYQDLGDRITEGTVLSNIGSVYYDLGDYLNALNSYQQTLHIRREMGDRSSEAIALNNIGTVYGNLGNYSQALDYFQQALSINRELGNRSSEGTNLDNIGSIYRNLGDYPQALDYFQQALSISRELSNRAEQGFTLNNIGLVYNHLADYANALDYFQQALNLRREIGDRLHEGTILNNIGLIYNHLGDYPNALNYFQQALNISQEVGDRNGEGTALNNLGSTYKDLGDYLNALDYYQQALTISQEIGDRRGEGTVLNNIGLIYNGLSDYANALDYYQQALNISQGIGNRAGEGTILHNIGATYSDLGDNVNALNYYQQALKISQSIGDRASEGRTIHSIGLVYDNWGDYSSALDYYQQALNLRREIGDRAGVTNTLNNIGLVYTHLADYPNALDYFQQSLILNQEIGDRGVEAAVLNNIGLVYQALGDYPQAFNYYQPSLSISREIGDRKREATTLSNIGDLLAQQNQPELAIVFLKQAVNQWEIIRNELQVLPSEQQESFTETVSDTYRQLADLLLQQDRVLEAQQVLDLLKIQELQEYLRDVRGNTQTVQGLDFWQPEQHIITLYKASLQRQEDFEQFVNRTEVIAQVDQLRRTARGQNLNPEQLASLQNHLQQLGQPAVILYPLILDDRLELVLVTPNGEPIRRTVNVRREQLNSALATLLPNLESRTRNAQPDAQQLYQWLIQPIEADLANVGATTILYAADGQLRYLPLGALYDGNQWLIQRFRINNITAASLLDFSPSQGNHLRVLAGAFSDSRLNYHFLIGTEDFTFSGLPHTKLEVENIAAEVPDTTQLLNHAFSRVAVESQMSNYSIIHLATHAEFVPGLPEESFILFGNGDRITLREVDSWNISNVDLVVLSACRTAVSGLGNGEEILGFGYQIQRTGAQAAIASLWYVDDASTQILMNAFYVALQQGMSEAEALRQAQIALITRDFSALNLPSEAIPTNNLNHPYYWAPFILIGNGL